VVNATDVHILIDHFYGPDGVAESQELLRLQPEPTLAEAAFQKGIRVGEQDVELLSVLFAETSRLTTELAVNQQMRTKRRIEASLEAMRGVRRLALTMDTVLFGTGVLLMLLAAYLALQGRFGSALTVGGLGIVNLALYLFKEPIESMHRSAANLLQLRTAYDAYFHELNQLGIAYEYSSGVAWLKFKAEAASIVFRATRAAVYQIEKYAKPAEERSPSLEKSAKEKRPSELDQEGSNNATASR
jgi:hypothetical protein